MKKIVGALALGCCLVSVSSQASVAEFVLNATPGDFISGGRQVDNIYSSADPLLIWNWANFNNIGTATTPSTNYISFTFLRAPWLVADDEYATLTFSTQQLGIPMTMGSSYFNAQRAAFASPGFPGLDISYGHRGCNTLTGNFTINNLTFNNNQLDLFSASFSQSCDGGALMSGTFSYNAHLTSINSVPVPAAAWLLGSGLFGLTGVARRKVA